MRLIDTHTLEFKEFIGSNVPEYAILSHTWEDEEVTFQEFSTLSDACRAKKGFAKIEQTCRLAREKELDYAWVDTCCIDKSSSAELTEAINSMFAWYKKSAICYTYLSDLHMIDSIKDKLPNCRWFTRGWTLQELIAPNFLEFYDANWKFCGSKDDLQVLLDSITGIPFYILSLHKDLFGRIQESISSLSIATRMSWAKNRETTRIEDIAYCLLGIFDVNMPLLYGEGNKAFMRLQEEIIRKDPDASLFLWKASEHDPEWTGVLAPTPNRFTINSGPQWGIKTLESTITNRGIKITTELFSTVMVGKVSDRDRRRYNYLLPLYESNKYILGLVVEKLDDGTYVRVNCVCGGVIETSRDKISSLQIITLYMMPIGESSRLSTWVAMYEDSGCQLELGTGLRILLATPGESWDPLSSIIGEELPMAFLLTFGFQPPTLFAVMSMDFTRDDGIYVVDYSTTAAHYIITKMAELKRNDPILSDFWGLEGVRFNESLLATTKIRTDTRDIIVRLQRRVEGVNSPKKLEISCSSQNNSNAMQVG